MAKEGSSKVEEDKVKTESPVPAQSEQTSVKKEDESDDEDVKMSDDEAENAEDKTSSPTGPESTGESLKRKREEVADDEEDKGIDDGDASPLKRQRSSTPPYPPPPPPPPPMGPGDDAEDAEENLKRKRDDGYDEDIKDEDGEFSAVKKQMLDTPPPPPPPPPPPADIGMDEDEKQNGDDPSNDLENQDQDSPRSDEVKKKNEMGLNNNHFPPRSPSPAEYGTNGSEQMRPSSQIGIEGRV